MTHRHISFSLLLHFDVFSLLRHFGDDDSLFASELLIKAHTAHVPKNRKGTGEGIQGGYGGNTNREFEIKTWEEFKRFTSRNPNCSDYV